MPYEELKLNKEFVFNDDKSTINYTKWSKYIDLVIEKVSENINDNVKIYNIFMKYLSNVPAINKENYKISLFDVCKINAALNNCIEKDKENLILIKGDISGIQNFIYKTNKDGALKNLKGRSLYLSILQDLISKYIVNKLKLDLTNILYSGGGNFYVVASESDIKEIKEIRERISNIMINAHRGELYVAIGFTKFSINELNDFSDIWRMVGDKTGKIKNRKWSESGLRENYNKIFGRLDNGATLEETCKVCGNIKEDQDNEYCNLCNSYKDLIDKSKNKKYYCEELVNIPMIKERYNTVHDIFEAFGYNIFFSNENSKSNDNIRVYAINNVEDEEVDGYLFKSVKLKTDSLDEISCTSSDIGDKKIGVLKLDVDNLGKLFIETKSIGHVMGLSRAISLFFEAFVENMIYNEEILENNKKFKDKVVIIYAGGDDTFIVGRYDEVFEFTYLLREMFRKYTNNEITFSAGLGMFDYNFPILQTAEITEEYLQLAKKETHKDKVCFLGEVFLWNQFKDIIEFKDRIEKIYRLTQSKGLFQKINNSTKGFKAIFKKGNNNINYIQVDKLAYYLRDLRNQDNKEVKLNVENLVDKYEEICLNAVKNKFINNQIMIIPYANKWAQCNCRSINKGV